MPSRFAAINPILGLRAGHSRPAREQVMLDDVYNKRILALAANIPLLERLKAPDATAKAHSKLCGSTVTVDVTMEGDVVTGFGHEVKACALGQASSSIMARHVVGSTAQELREVREQARAILKENAEPPQPVDDALRNLRLPVDRHRIDGAGAKLMQPPDQVRRCFVPVRIGVR